MARRENRHRASRILSTFSALGLVTLVATGPSHAAGPTWQGPFHLSDSRRDAGSPQVAATHDGRAAIAWHATTAHGARVGLAYSSRGGRFERPRHLLGGAVATGWPLLAAAPGGPLVLAWKQWNGRTWAERAGIVGADGRVARPKTLTQPTELPQEAQLAVGPRGDAVVVWERFNGRHYVIRASVRPAGGQFGAAVRISVPGGNAYLPHAAVDERGNVIVVWKRFSGVSYVVEASVRPAGRSFSEPVRLSSPTRDGDYPRIATSAAGRATVVWQHWSGGRSSVYVAQRSPGSVFGPEVRLSGRDEEARLPQVGVTTAGDAAVVYESRGEGGETIKAVRIERGVVAGAPVALSSRVGQARLPQVTVGFGRALAIWERRKDKRWSIRAAQLWKTDLRSSRLSGSGDAQLPQITLLGSGSALAVWQHRRRGRWLIAGATLGR